jgi:hypothetical protein
MGRVKSVDLFLYYRFLYYRFHWLRGGYRIRVPMHNLPGALFGPEDHRNPQSRWGEVLHFVNLDLVSLQLHMVGKLRSNILHYGLDASGLAISEIRCGVLQGLRNLLPSPRGRAKGVSEAYVFSMGEELLGGRRASWQAQGFL